MEQNASDSSRPDYPLQPNPARLRLVESADPGTRESALLDESLRALHLQTLELYVSPFRSFRDVGRFQQALLELPSVRTVRPRGLQRGTLQLRVQCTDARDLLLGLQSAFYLPLHLVSQQAHQIELQLGEQGEGASFGEESLPA